MLGGRGGGASLLTIVSLHLLGPLMVIRLRVYQSSFEKLIGVN